MKWWAKRGLEYLRNMLLTNLFYVLIQKNKLELPRGTWEAMHDCWSETSREQLVRNEINEKLSLRIYCRHVSGGNPGTSCCPAEPKVQKKSLTCREVRTSWDHWEPLCLTLIAVRPSEDDGHSSTSAPQISHNFLVWLMPTQNHYGREFWETKFPV